MADVIREFLTCVGIVHCLTLAYSKEENAIVERYNKENNRYLRGLTFDNNSLDDYKISLPFVQRILNSSHSVGRNGCIALHYYVHFLRIFSFVTRGIESEGIGARSVRFLNPFV